MVHRRSVAFLKRNSLLLIICIRTPNANSNSASEAIKFFSPKSLLRVDDINLTSALEVSREILGSVNGGRNRNEFDIFIRDTKRESFYNPVNRTSSATTSSGVL